ncbi:uncharacterized protein DNG_10195 [Cephalotrichum gorgonifer]|uniref:Uncharacterized protein n=1 Tax=Cephalotrichum gorgonifer TaxID=2041049 RepID=A0AAE8T045_9PEZI|nr:uncharacterized protein DNG_10195 [Cephalotrichum gorgonifer]
MRLFINTLPLLVLSFSPFLHAAPTADDPSCSHVEEEPPAPTYEYAICGGDRRDGPLQCADDHACVDDPRKGGCGMACDDTGICVPPGLEMCGGFAGFECPEGLHCIDNPFDDCTAEAGWADCAGVCV